LQKLEIYAYEWYSKQYNLILNLFIIISTHEQLNI
jgi:hypothetical protein